VDSRGADMKLTSDSRNAIARGQQLYRHALLELLAVTCALGCDGPLASRRANLTREALYRRYRIARDALLVPRLHLVVRLQGGMGLRHTVQLLGRFGFDAARSEERRVGKGCRRGRSP